MRGIVWSQMIKMIIVIVVVVIMFQMFSFAFGQGKNVLTGGLDWVENKTGIGVGPDGPAAYSIAIESYGPGRINYVIDIAAGTSSELELQVFKNGVLSSEQAVTTEDGVFRGTATFRPNIMADMDLSLWSVEGQERVRELEDLSVFVFDLDRLEKSEPNEFVGQFVQQASSSADARASFELIEDSCGACEPLGQFGAALSAYSEVQLLACQDLQTLEKGIYGALKNCFVPPFSMIDIGGEELSAVLYSCADNWQNLEGDQEQLLRTTAADIVDGTVDDDELFDKLERVEVCARQYGEIASQLYCDPAFADDSCWIGSTCDTVPHLSCSRPVGAIER